MIEQAMIFTLGFLLAGLAALAIAPAFWRRAVRLARRRIEAQVPVSIHEILAERDQLRAQNAVECRRIEDRATALNQRHAADLEELGRRAAKIVALETDLATRNQECHTQAAENERMARELNEANATVAASQKAFFDVHSDHERRWDALVDLRQSLSSTAALAEVRLASLTASDNYAKDLERRLAALKTDFAGLVSRLKDQAREIGELKDSLGISRSDLARAQKKLEVDGARAADLEAAASAMQLQRKSDLTELRSLNLKLENSKAELRELREREGALLAKAAKQAERLRESEASFSEQLHALQADGAALRGALAVARRRCDELEAQLALARRSEPSKAGASESDENAALRQGINEIGAAMIRLASLAGERPHPTSAETCETDASNGAARNIVANGPSRPMPEPAKAAPSRDEPETPLALQNRVEI